MVIYAYLHIQSRNYAVILMPPSHSHSLSSHSLSVCRGWEGIYSDVFILSIYVSWFLLRIIRLTAAH